MAVTRGRWSFPVNEDSRELMSEFRVVIDVVTHAYTAWRHELWPLGAASNPLRVCLPNAGRWRMEYRFAEAVPTR